MQPEAPLSFISEMLRYAYSLYHCKVFIHGRRRALRPFALCALSALSANLGEVAAPIELVTKVMLRSELVCEKQKRR